MRGDGHHGGTYRRQAREHAEEHPWEQGIIRAAGCVLWRRAPEGGIEIALVHRPEYDDWSHAKGKLDPGESALTAALREVAEETGMDCEPGPALPTVRYTVRGRAKEVRYWAAEVPPCERFVPNPEVDRLLWLRPEAARPHLTHEHDRVLVDALLTTLDLV
ncbi:NUDIX hydrolase [Streptomyces sp. F63]|uniref:NUDIX hydrolase n=1 Tax=Streptomyces sp. F63 TaxID=2824887 RepID=UPI001B358642|nr:NUDIX hydrolase [Streptomyces sp. F63]MBQ0987818.1 NUDIX hydrolase [Streptomyces sp. F63]